MAAGTPTVESLRKILLEERKNGFQNTTVIGGLDRFLELRSDDLRPLIGDVGSYSRLTPDERRSWAGAALASLASLPREPASTPGRPPSGRPPPGKAQAARRARMTAAQPDVSLDDDVSRLKGVSTKTAALLQKLGVRTVRDLVFLVPHRHSDFGNIRAVSELDPGEDQTVVATVWEASVTRHGAGKGSTQAILGDGTANVRAIWFNNPWMARTLRPGVRVVLSGKVNVFRGQPVFESPEYELLQGQEELLHTARFVPFYPLVDGLYQRTLRRIVKQALDSALPKVEERLPADLMHRTGLLGLNTAILQSHYPDSLTDRAAAWRRLAFDELFLIQLAVLARKRAWQQKATGIPLRDDPGLLDAFLVSLPFRLTGAQSRVLREVLDDLGDDRPMSRMVQGDVGSGKTVVAAAALLVAAFNGYQGALMVPTEILAEQHFLTLSHLLSGLAISPQGETLITVGAGAFPRPVTIGLLVGSLSKAAKDEVQRRLAAGEVDIAIGTHALIQSGVEIPRLALAVVDEQHRFGVMQRASLREKGPRPHLMAMSATPIPRSLALTLYGDLDMSIIDEMPPGRRQIRTRRVAPGHREAGYSFIRREVQAGRQAFIVCPLIDESEAVQSRAAVEEHRRLSEEVYPDLRVGLLHGRMALREKELVMEEFQRGELDVLVSTPVIEVGIDVANATVMLIDGADRFGLAQLHQLRGRVGRGAHQGYCLLLSDSPGEEARERLKIVERLHDGFLLAEEDLRMRGPGEYMGTRQAGLPDLKVARITDQDILALARREAARLLDADPELARSEHAALAAEVKRLSARLTDEMS